MLREECLQKHDNSDRNQFIHDASNWKRGGVNEAPGNIEEQSNMNSITELDANRKFRIGEDMRIYRNDGTNRAYEATCTHIEPGGIALRTQAVFTVGEVVEFSFAGGGEPSQDRHPARVMYRTSDRYGLGLLNAGTRKRQPAPVDADHECCLQAARQMLAELKAAYDTLPAAHKEAVRNAITANLANPEVAA